MLMKSIKVYSILFFVAIFSMMGVTVSEVIRNRNSDEKKEMDNVTWIPDFIDKTIKDNIPQKKALMTADVYYTKFVIDKVSSQLVEVGNNNFIFLITNNESDCELADYQCSKKFTQQEIENGISFYSKMQNFCKDRNIEFFALCAPNKSKVYSQYMPPSICKGDVSRNDILFEACKNAGINIIYPKAELIEASRNNIVYYPYDSHWNRLGAYVGARLILKNWGVDLPALESVQIETDGEGDNDLCKWINLSFPQTEESKKFYPVDFKKYYDMDYDFDSVVPAGPYINPEPVIAKKLLVVGDSYRMSLSPVMAGTFAETYIMYNGIWDWKPCEKICEAIEQVNPDYVLYVSVERYNKLLTME